MQQTMQLHERGLVSKVDYDAWLAHTGAIIKTPGGTAMWSQMESTVTPTIRKLINQYMADNPDIPSFIEVIPLYKYVGEEAATDF